MTQPRSKQVAIEATPYYHCVSRCVRRAFLCGRDSYSGRSYEHRRAWLEERILQLSEAFTIDIAAYAIMNNHYHVVLCVDKSGSESLSAREVIERWHQVFKGTALSKNYIANLSLSPLEMESLNTLVMQWRKRLSSISWFMRCINEHIARKANIEDDCTGRFWEGRFKSQALLDEKSLLACMAYVDLNPIRAGFAKSLQKSAHTSIKRRMKNAKKRKKTRDNLDLLPFHKPEKRNCNIPCLPFSFIDYLTLVEWTGRQIKERKKDYIKDNIPPLLTAVKFNPSIWLYASQHFESKFKTIVGCGIKLSEFGKKFGIKRIAGKTACIQTFST
jgi:REP element-mobilizing transposase RayT